MAFHLYSTGKDLVHSLHLGVNKKGTWPGLYLVGKDEKHVYNAPIRFSYTKLADKKKEPVVFRALTRQINEYVRSSERYGTDEVVEIPITLKMKLAPEGKKEVKKIILGPPPPPKREKKVIPKKKKNFFGF